MLGLSAGGVLPLKEEDGGQNPDVSTRQLVELRASLSEGVCACVCVCVCVCV